MATINGGLPKQNGGDPSKLHSNADLSPQSVTDHVHAVNAASDERTKFLFTKLVDHLHDFVRETKLTTDEWMSTIKFLTETGKISTGVRQEFILLSDILGVSVLVDAINYPTPPGATEAALLGPFYTEDAYQLQKGDSIASEGKGDYLFVEGRVLDTQGKPIVGAVIDAWETDGTGLYDNQYVDRERPECRGKFLSTEDGSYAFGAVIPVSYPIPNDGPAVRILNALGRHPYRPAHLHVMIQAPGYEKLVTQLYFKGDPYLMSDVVFGVRTSLIVDPEKVKDEALTVSRGFKNGSKGHAYVKHDFVLATVEEAKEARKDAVVSDISKLKIGN
ncbi:intradiol ring-cleavage dioxygenase [Pluteus cervinus]|uniref:Intradiol ring-cleavage dioxygenase n=1 Tax=Pluteus cervinus TaxID=181527 RepID=A0ACD3AHA1_9AGAR|nr:intradiol ring-cleavage dioxygenase [Pluteus cervinus]